MTSNPQLWMQVPDLELAEKPTEGCHPDNHVKFCCTSD
jgi:hypothetical protein